ncbi:MAG: hypothetical protein FWG05_02095, partial [Kiritimatiellaeota bacterium]|nr:hypothetical protein [Kiritimatiellota bacterium]
IFEKNTKIAMKTSRNPLLLLSLIVCLLTLCSCASDFRAKSAEKYGIKRAFLPQVEGMWQNTRSKSNGWWNYLDDLSNEDKESVLADKARSDEYALTNKSYMETTLWERFTGKKSAPDAIVELKLSDERNLTAVLWHDGEKIDSRSFRFKQKNELYELPTRHEAIPLLWYFIWGWQQNEIALGINDTGNLCVNHGQQGVFVITILPTPIGGGGNNGNFNMYDRVK